jgi:hypothetical protein
MGMGGMPGIARKIRIESCSCDPDKQCGDRVPLKQMGRKAVSSGTGPRTITPADDIFTRRLLRRPELPQQLLPLIFTLALPC